MPTSPPPPCVIRRPLRRLVPHRAHQVLRAALCSGPATGPRKKKEGSSNAGFATRWNQVAGLVAASHERPREEVHELMGRRE